MSKHHAPMTQRAAQARERYARVSIAERVPGAAATTAASVTAGVVHFGVGGFHRAHQAMYHDRLMNEGEALDWGDLRRRRHAGDKAMKEALDAQDGLYTLVLKHSDGTYEPRVIGSIVEYLFAPDDPEAVLEKLAAETTRIVSLTVTEGGYNLHHVTGEFDADDPGVAARPRAGRGAADDLRDRLRGARAGGASAGSGPSPSCRATTSRATAT